MKRVNGNHVVDLKTLSICSSHPDPELLHGFDDKSDDSMCMREKSLYSSGFQHFLSCDPIKEVKPASDLLSHVMASLWT